MIFIGRQQSHTSSAQKKKSLFEAEFRCELEEIQTGLTEKKLNRDVFVGVLDVNCIYTGLHCSRSIGLFKRARRVVCGLST
jgi:hypothetical protein